MLVIERSYRQESVEIDAKIYVIESLFFDAVIEMSTLIKSTINEIIFFLLLEFLACKWIRVRLKYHALPDMNSPIPT